MRVAGDVDQDIAEQPVDQPRRHPIRAARRRHFAGGDFKFVEQILARFVDARRLAGRADEQAGEQIGQRRPAQPVEHQAFQQIGPAQERTVGGVQAAEHDVIAAAGAGMSAVDHEFVGAEPRRMRILVKPRVISTASRHDAAGWMLTSMTPGSGVTLSTLSRGSGGGA